jgi:hypothetical protein
MTQTEHLVRKLPNDIGGDAAGHIERVEHELEPWEKRCHALADVLDFYKIINTEEKRRGVEALGSEMVTSSATTSGGSWRLPTSCFRKASWRPRSWLGRWTR